jgi:hypothetical protein
MTPVPKDQTENEKAIQDYLDKGGKITVCDAGARTENLVTKSSFYGRRNKKAEEGKE